MTPWWSRLIGVAVAVAAAAGVTGETPFAQSGEPSSRIVAIGDIHGAYQEFVALLRELDLLDDQGRWSGGTATLVQTGDYTDRGASVRAVMDLLMRLERQAEAAGGRVAVLLGNHEAMNLTRFPRDVSPAAYLSFVDDRSETRRREAYDRYVRFNHSRRSDLGHDPPGVLAEDVWMQAHPPGFLEYLEALGPDGHYGRWLREKDAVVRIGETLFLHGGLNPAYTRDSINDINNRLRSEISRLDRYWRRLADRPTILPMFTLPEGVEAARADLQQWMARWQNAPPGFGPSGAERSYAEMLVDLLQVGTWSILHDDGPLWFRGYRSWSAEEGSPQIDQVLERYDVRRIVVGHSIPTAHEIVARFDSRVFLIDTGMLSDVYVEGQPSALEIVGDRVTAVYMGERKELVSGGPPARHP